MVEQEFLSLTKEHLILVTESLGELEAPGSSPRAPRQPAPYLLVPPLVADGSECPGASVSASDKLLEPKVAVSVIGSRQGCDSAMPTVTGILRAPKGTEDKGHSLGTSNSEICKLLAQFPLRSMETSKAPDNKVLLEETKVIKDFLQNSMFSGPRPREATELGPCLLLSPPPPSAPSDKLPELPAQTRQLPVFAQLCSKSKADPAVEGHHLMGEWGCEQGWQVGVQGREPHQKASRLPQCSQHLCAKQGKVASWVAAPLGAADLSARGPPVQGPADPDVL